MFTIGTDMKNYTDQSVGYITYMSLFYESQYKEFPRGLLYCITKMMHLGVKILQFKADLRNSKAINLYRKFSKEKCICTNMTGAKCALFSINIQSAQQNLKKYT